MIKMHIHELIQKEINILNDFCSQIYRIEKRNEYVKGDYDYITVIK